MNVRSVQPVGAFVCGLLSLIFALMFFWFPFPALVLGIVGTALAAHARRTLRTGLFPAALVLSILGLIFAFLGFLATMLFSIAA